MATTMNLLSSSGCLHGPQRPVFGCSKRSACPPRCRTTCQATPSSSGTQAEAPFHSRRNALMGLTAIPLGLAVGSAAPALAKDTAQVGSYLPASDIPGFAQFVPDRSKTPALRAGTVDRDQPYRFSLPASWREQQVANIQSGNYCQPKCGEPWTEVIFSDSAEGKVQVIVSPLVRVTNESNAPIESVGTPEGLLISLGSYITGTYLDEEDVKSIQKKKGPDGLTYYQYEAFAPYGSLGPHTLTTVTTKGELLLMLTISASDKQWGRSESKLRQMLDTFTA